MLITYSLCKFCTSCCVWEEGIKNKIIKHQKPLNICKICDLCSSALYRNLFFKWKESISEKLKLFPTHVLRFIVTSLLNTWKSSQWSWDIDNDVLRSSGSLTMMNDKSLNKFNNLIMIFLFIPNKIFIFIPFIEYL